MTASFTLGKVTIKQISNKEWNEIQKNSIKDWHFERSSNGVKPVAGEYDPNNPNHIPIRKVVRRGEP